MLHIHYLINPLSTYLIRLSFWKSMLPLSDSSWNGNLWVLILQLEGVSCVAKELEMLRYTLSSFFPTPFHLLTRRWGLTNLHSNVCLLKGGLTLEEYKIGMGSNHFTSQSLVQILPGSSLAIHDSRIMCSMEKCTSFYVSPGAAQNMKLLKKASMKMIDDCEGCDVFQPWKHK